MSLGKKKIQHQAAAGELVNTENFAPVTYTGNRLARSISTGFAPDFVWIKNRPQGDPHMLFDSVRGATKFLFSNDTDAEGTSATSLTSFNADSFSLGAYDGRTNELIDYVAWCWKAGGTAVSNTDGSIASTVSANPDAGFSVVSYTGNGNSSATVGHGLSEAPDIYIIKRRDSASNWVVFTTTLLGGTPQNFINLNGTAAAGVASQPLPDSSVINVQPVFDNINNATYIAYCFHSVDGYQKVGSYNGTGTVNNQINVGFRPRFVMQKRSDSTGSWNIIDNLRGDDNYLSANLSNAEGSMTASSFHLTDTGFTLDNSFSEWNASGGTYIYLAIA